MFATMATAKARRYRRMSDTSVSESEGCSRKVARRLVPSP
jgi:hypothetical protein